MKPSRLFEPLSIGNLHFKNRIAMAPMTRSRAGSARVPCVKGLLCE
jgi:2,4-dienoyl-CoA reductase-like NADH-dependent reductase (Old Yellow Enzyme family)